MKHKIISMRTYKQSFGFDYEIWSNDKTIWLLDKDGNEVIPLIMKGGKR